jgi:GNAT superfamily N-acetyltransferase
MIDIRKGPEHTDFDTVHSWLASSYWSPNIPREKVERAAKNSKLVINAYRDGRQVGYCRVISDLTSFAWLCDVFVDESARGQGVAKTMVQAALDDPDHQDMRRWMLGTRDAHTLYEQFGFGPLEDPARWMIKRQSPGQGGP